MSHPALRRALCLAALVVTLAACGKKGDPRPPILLVPAPTTDLSVVQRGGRLLLDLAYPQTTAAGTPLPGLAELAVWELVWQAPAGTEGPLETDERRFLAGAQPVRVLSGDELSEAVAGDRVQLALDVPAPEPEGTGLPALTLAVKTQGPGGEESAFSNRVTFALVEPPEPPTEIEAEGVARGVRLRWSYAAPAREGAEEEAEAEVTDVETEEEPAAEDVDEAEESGRLAGFHVYRRLATERTYGPPIRTVGRRGRTVVDGNARFGQSYIYTVTAVASRRPAVIESEFAEEVEVVYRDLFAPPVPQGLVALAEGSQVRLVWEASEAPDLAGYRLYRRGPDTQEFRALTEEILTGTDFTDRNLPAGATYTYQVTAVDRLGNESRPSPPATAAIR